MSKLINRHQNNKCIPNCRHLEKEVRERTRELVIANRIKSEFIADVSHELRIPLSIIKANFELAKKKGFGGTDESKGFVLSIKEEIEQISGIVSDLTILTERRDGKIILRTELIQLDILIKEIYKKTKILARKKNVKVSMLKVEKIFSKVDRKEFIKLIMNLVSNAVNYSQERGKIDLSLIQEDGWAKIIIADNGLGIPKKDLPYIFGRFYQVDKTRLQEKGGSGLGLAISKWAAEAHGGKITVKSEEGKGSEFTIWLPLRALKGGKR